MDKKKQNIMDNILCILVSLMRKWKVIVVCALICGMGVDLFKTFTFEKQYVSSMSISLQKGDGYSYMDDNIDYTKTMAYILKSNVVENYIKDEMKVDTLPGTIVTNPLNDTQILKIEVYSDSVATSYHMLSLITKWYESNRMLFEEYNANIIETKLINEAPVNSNSHIRNLMKGAVLMTVLLSAFFIISAYLKDNVKSAEAFVEKIDAPLLAKLPFEIKKGKNKKKALLITDLKTSFSYTESVKKLCSRIERRNKQKDCKTLLVTSSIENEGKSSVSANLALGLAKRNYKVLLIDGDMRKPAVKKIFDMTYGNVSAVIEGKSTLNKEIVHIQKYDLYVLGGEVADMTHGVNEKAWEKVLSNCCEQFDYIVIDGSPCRFISDSLELAGICDATIMVVKQNEAPAKLINDTIHRLKISGANVMGCVFNRSVVSPVKTISNYSARYGYGMYGKYRDAGRRNK